MKIEKFMGDVFWDAADTDNSVEPGDHMDDVGCGQVIEFQQAKTLPNFYGVRYYDTEKDEYLCEFFTTAEEAQQLCVVSAGDPRQGEPIE